MRGEYDLIDYPFSERYPSELSLSYSVSEFYILPCLNLIVDQACSNEGQMTNEMYLYSVDHGGRASMEKNEKETRIEKGRQH